MFTKCLVDTLTHLDLEGMEFKHPEKLEWGLFLSNIQILGRLASMVLHMGHVRQAKSLLAISASDRQLEKLLRF